MHISTHMHHGAFRIKEPGKNGVRSYLRCKTVFVEQGHIRVSLLSDQITVGAQGRHMSWLGRQFQLARTAKTALDDLVFNNLFDKIDAGIIGVVQLARTFTPEALNRINIGMRQTIAQVATIAPRRPFADRTLLKDSNVKTCFCQGPRRCQAGEPCANDDDVVSCLWRTSRSRKCGRCRHPVGSGGCHNPTSAGRALISGIISVSYPFAMISTPRSTKTRRPKPMS